MNLSLTVAEARVLRTALDVFGSRLAKVKDVVWDRTALDSLAVKVGDIMGGPVFDGMTDPATYLDVLAKM